MAQKWSYPWGNRSAFELDDPRECHPGPQSVQRWKLPDGWVIPNRQAPLALVSEDDFIAAQDVNAARRPVRRTSRWFAVTCSPG